MAQEATGIQDDAWVELESDCGLIYYWNRKSLESVQMLPKGVEAMWAVRKSADGRACFWQKPRSDETAAKPMIWALPPSLSALAGQSWAGKPQAQGTLTEQSVPAISTALTASVERSELGASIAPAVEAEFGGEAVPLQLPALSVSELAVEEPVSLVLGMHISSAAPVPAAISASQASTCIAQDSVISPAASPGSNAHVAHASLSMSLGPAPSIVVAVPVVQSVVTQVREGAPVPPDMSMQSAGLITHAEPMVSATHPTCSAIEPGMAEKAATLEVVQSQYDKQEVETANAPGFRTRERELSALNPPVDVVHLSAKIAEATSDSMQLREELSRLKAELAALATAGSPSEQSVEPVHANASAFAPKPTSADRLTVTLKETSADISASVSDSRMVQCADAAVAEAMSQDPCARFESTMSNITSSNACGSSELAQNVKKVRSRERSSTQPHQVAPSNMGAHCETNESWAKTRIPHWQIWLRAKQQEEWLKSNRKEADKSQCNKSNHESQECTNSGTHAAQAKDTSKRMDPVRCKSSPRLPSSEPRLARVLSPGQKKRKATKTGSKKTTRPAVTVESASAEAVRAAAYHAQMAHYQFTAHVHYQQQCQAAAAAHAHYQASAAFQHQLATQMSNMAPPVSAHSGYCVSSGSTWTSDPQNSTSSKRSRSPARGRPKSSAFLGSTGVKKHPHRSISGKRSRSPARWQPKASPSRSLSRSAGKKTSATSIGSKRFASPARWRPEASPSRSLSRDRSSSGSSKLAPKVASCIARRSPSRSPSSTRTQGSPPDKQSKSEQPAAFTVSKTPERSSRPRSASVSSRGPCHTTSKSMLSSKEVGSRSRLPSPARSRQARSRSAVRRTVSPANTLRCSPTRTPSSTRAFSADTVQLAKKSASNTPSCSGSKAGSQDLAIPAGKLFAKAVGGLAPKVARLRKRSSLGGA
eukprot:TRINITY_DN88583_c0_g1_i1.p1 TRINITY_DN88583_c0_g1~~TRINITY_DN88583_c0_g1_i1.p1  ORF type:complete len:958 (-),score=134.86 TRINITY_DN88583_c0_g1_i1:200-3001(-)